MSDTSTIGARVCRRSVPPPVTAPDHGGNRGGGGSTPDSASPDRTTRPYRVCSKWAKVHQVAAVTATAVSHAAYSGLRSAVCGLRSAVCGLRSAGHRAGPTTSPRVDVTRPVTGASGQRIAAASSADTADTDRAPGRRRLDGTAGLSDLHLACRDQTASRAASGLHEFAPAVALPLVHRPRGVRGTDRLGEAATFEQLQDRLLQAPARLPFAFAHHASITRPTRRGHAQRPHRACTQKDDARRIDIFLAQRSQGPRAGLPLRPTGPLVPRMTPAPRRSARPPTHSTPPACA